MKVSRGAVFGVLSTFTVHRDGKLLSIEFVLTPMH